MMADQFTQSLIYPDWPAPKQVKSIQTTRHGGVSQSPYDSLNLGDHVNDNPQHVAYNRQLLNAIVPTEPVWLNQVHGIEVIDAAQASCIASADASFTAKQNVVCATMTADCLPVLLCDQNATTVAAIHAGWRGLCDGVIEATIQSMPVDAKHLMAWLGPAIGPQAFEVGDEVRTQFIDQDAQAEQAFQAKDGKWLGDLYLIARQRLLNLDVTAIYGGGDCTYSNPTQYFSFRRDGDTGRMASLIWLAQNDT